MLKNFKLKKIKGNVCAQKSKKMSIITKNVIGSEDTLMYKAQRSSNNVFQHFHT